MIEKSVPRKQRLSSLSRLRDVGFYSYQTVALHQCVKTGRMYFLKKMLFLILLLIIALYGCNNLRISLTLKTPIATKVVCFSLLLNFLRSLYGKQCGPRSNCSRSTLFVSIVILSVMLSNNLQQTTTVNDIFRCIFFLML